MSQDFQPGQRVLYHPIGTDQPHLNESTGIIRNILDHDEQVGFRNVHADPTNQKIVIENEHTHKQQAVMVKSIVRILGENELVPETQSEIKPEENPMPSPYNVGQHVLYHPVGTDQPNLNETTGIIRNILDHDDKIGHRNVHADPMHQKIVIENDHTHKQQAVMVKSIIRVLGENEAVPEIQSESKPEDNPTQYKVGQHVEYHPVGADQPYLGTSTGVIQKILTHNEEPGSVLATKVHADQKHPRLVILNDYTKKESVRGPESILRVLSESDKPST